MVRGPRWVLAAVGLVAVAFGIAVAVAPGLVPFAVGRGVVGGLAALGVVLALASIQSRRQATVETATLPSPTNRRQLVRPGADLDRLIERGFSESDADAARARERLRERLYPLAVGVVMRRENVSRDRARRLLATGEWTDDRLAARYFAGPRVGIPLPVWLLHRVRGRSLREVYARRAIDELAAEVVE